MAKKKTSILTNAWFRTRMDDLGYRTLQDLSNATGINRGNLYRYFSLETRPSIDVVPVLCNALNLETDELLKALRVKGY